jgi:tRNA A37 threonylcarbamoyladenosine synthetase subunit TsaC/SUA5/YrdC
MSWAAAALAAAADATKATQLGVRCPSDPELLDLIRRQTLDTPIKACGIEPSVK